MVKEHSFLEDNPWQDRGRLHEPLRSQLVHLPSIHLGTLGLHTYPFHLPTTSHVGLHKYRRSVENLVIPTIYIESSASTQLYPQE